VQTYVTPVLLAPALKRTFKLNCCAYRWHWRRQFGRNGDTGTSPSYEQLSERTLPVCNTSCRVCDAEYNREVDKLGVGQRFHFQTEAYPMRGIHFPWQVSILALHRRMLDVERPRDYAATAFLTPLVHREQFYTDTIRY
jgi:hypothetical protein